MRVDDRAVVSTPLSSLVVGDRVVSRCDDGLLDAEYALFDRSEVILASAAGQGVREEGYMTTAGFARARLHQALVTTDLAYEAFAALRTRHMRPLARSPEVAEILDQLGPYEAFEGGTFRAERGRYAGVWLDLDTLASAAPVRGAGVLFQAMHLLLVLEEVGEDVPVRLLTGAVSDERRPGERTWRKVALEAAQRLPWVLREMQAPARPRTSSRDEAEVREEILRNLQARATASAHAQPRLHALAAAVAHSGWTPPAGMPAQPAEAPPTQRMPSRPHRPSSSPPKPPSKPPSRPPSKPPVVPPPPRVPVMDPMPIVGEVRKQTDLLRGGDQLRAVAQSLSTMAQQSGGQPDLVMLAARAWLAAGEHGFARHFARQIVDNASVPDDVRIAAFEIMETTPATQESMRPPPTAPISPSPVILVAPQMDRAVPRGASLPPMAPEPADIAHRFLQPPPAAALVVSRAEILETLALGPGLSEDMLPAGAIPRNEQQARVAMTRLARHLGRDYRLWYGTTLKTDVMAVDAMQRHLRRRFADGALDEKRSRQLEVELTRHGATLSEILARTLGAQWVDLSSPQPGHWSMIVPPGTRVWPIGRVYRFFGQGHREADLVAFYMELRTGHSRGEAERE